MTTQWYLILKECRGRRRRPLIARRKAKGEEEKNASSSMDPRLCSFCVPPLFVLTSCDKSISSGHRQRLRLNLELPFFFFECHEGAQHFLSWSYKEKEEEKKKKGFKCLLRFQRCQRVHHFDQDHADARVGAGGAVATAPASCIRTMTCFCTLTWPDLRTPMVRVSLGLAQAPMLRVCCTSSAWIHTYCITAGPIRRKSYHQAQRELP